MQNVEKLTPQKHSNDFETQAVPLNQRKSFFSLTIVWTGFVFLVTSMMAGGGLAQGLNFTQILLVTILGNLFLSIIAMLVSYLAGKTGLSFALITRYSFGIKGSKIATLFVPTVNIGWYTIQCALYGHFVSMIFGIEGWRELITMFISAIVMGIFALIGMRAITILGYIAIPSIIFLSIATAMKATLMVGGFHEILAYLPPKTFSMSQGVTIVIGTWILSTATCIADIMRYAKTTKQAMLSSFLGLVGGNSLLILCGAIAAIGAKESDLTTVLLSLGLIVPSFILMTTNIFTTNAANLYSTSLNLSNSFKMSRRKMIFIILIISGLLTMTRPYNIDSLFLFLGALGKIVPPLAGIILADYYIVNKGNYKTLSEASMQNWNLVPWIVWGVVIVFVFSFDRGLPALNGIILAGLLYPIVTKFFKAKKGRKDA